MKTIGISDKEKQLLFIVLSVLLLVCAYFFGFTKLMDQAELIENSNKQDQATLKELQAMFDKQEEKKAETKQYKDKIYEIVHKYPVRVPQEKAITILQMMEDTLCPPDLNAENKGKDFHIDTINFSMNNLVMDFSGDGAPKGCFDVMGIHFTCRYEQFKSLLKYVLDYADRSTAPSVSVEFDQITGILSGNINYRMYYLTKTESEFDDRSYDESFKEYAPLPIESGVEEYGIFGALTEQTAPLLNEDGNPVINEETGEPEESNGFVRENYLYYVAPEEVDPDLVPQD